MDPHESISNEVRDKTLAHWKSFPCFPTQLPPQWDDNVLDTTYAPEPYWMEFMNRRPRSPNDRPWWFERAHHCYGTLVPLMNHPQQNIEMSQAGGLLFLTWNNSLEECFVVHPGPSAEQLAIAVNVGQLPPHEPIPRDLSARVKWINNYYMWRWELAQGRNRWEEMKQRGADVDLSFISSSAEWCYTAPLIHSACINEDSSPAVAHSASTYNSTDR